MAKLGEWSCPSGKIPHLTREGAGQQLRGLKHHRKSQGMEVYRCRLCDHWHVGHPKGFRWKAKAIRRGRWDGQLPSCS